MNENEKNEKKVFDFTKVSIEVEFEKFEEVNVSKLVGNTIHINTADIGVDDLARKIYREGKAEISDENIRKQIVAIVMQSGIVAPVKLALKKLLED